MTTSTLCHDGGRHQWDSLDRSHARCKICDATRRQVNSLLRERFKELDKQPASDRRMSMEESLAYVRAKLGHRGAEAQRRAA